MFWAVMILLAVMLGLSIYALLKVLGNKPYDNHLRGYGRKGFKL
jgi:hypothetical protein